MKFNTAALLALTTITTLTACGGGGGDSAGTTTSASISATATSATAATVLRVHDGDTLTVNDAAHGDRNIRFSGIDAPETNQPYGSASTQSLSGLVLSQTVGVVGDKIDLYGRTVAIITLNGQDINLTQIQRGLAWHYKAYASEQTTQNAALYAAAEVQARAAKLGLWAATTPIAPWDWRAGMR